MARQAGKEDDDRDAYREEAHRDDRDDDDDGQGGVTYFAYDKQGRLIGEYSRRQAMEYVWMGRRPVAVVNREEDSAPKIYTIHVDHLGTPRQVTDGNTVVWEWYGEPFGTSVPDEDPGQTGKRGLGAHYQFLVCLLHATPHALPHISNQSASTTGSGEKRFS